MYLEQSIFHLLLTICKYAMCTEVTGSKNVQMIPAYGRTNMLLYLLAFYSYTKVINHTKGMS